MVCGAFWHPQMDSGCISMCWGAFSCSTVSSGKTGYLELGYPALEARSGQAPGIPEHTPISLLVQAKPFKVGSLGVAGVLKTAFLQHLLYLGGWVDVLKSGSLGARYMQGCRLSCKMPARVILQERAADSGRAYEVYNLLSQRFVLCLLCLPTEQ